MATVVIKSHVNQAHASAARKVLAQLGLKPSDAINVLFAQIASRRALPFALATADSDYAWEEYGLDGAGVISAGAQIRRRVAVERRKGTVRQVNGIADLRE